MSTGYKIQDNGLRYFVTFTIVDWVDVFTRKAYKDEIINSLHYCQTHKGLNIFAYVIMSNHLHLIISAREGFLLSDIIRDFKKFTARKILELAQTEEESRREWMLHRFGYNAAHRKRNSEHQIWQQTNHARGAI